MIQSDTITAVASPPVAADSVPAPIVPQKGNVRPVAVPDGDAGQVASAVMTATPDSVSPDTVKAKEFGIIITARKTPEVALKTDNAEGMSYVLGGLLLLFCIIGIRFRNNRKYMGRLLRDMVEIRMRGNVFDQTVRETSFLVLLNLLWGCSAGIILWGLLGAGLPDVFQIGMNAPPVEARPAATMAICMGIGVGYTCLMALAYITVGIVFSNRVNGRMWLKGFSAGNGVMSFIYFPLAMVLIFYPQWRGNLLWVALIAFILAKIVFIWKGFRIFFTQISSWVLFLYYLCSLEIVPLILTYLAALQLCNL